jgi:hypothetical protein
MKPAAAQSVSPTLTIDPEFAALGTDLSPEEANLLEASLEADGCRDPIVTWANHDDTILDGHNRYRICRRFEIAYKARAIALETRGDAINWIIANQLGRRNLSEEQKSYYRGKRYHSEKKAEGRPEQLGQNDPVRTSERLGEEYQVAEATIRRDAAFAQAVDTIAEAAGPEAKRAILSGSIGATKKDVIALATLPAGKIKKTIAAGKEALKNAARGNGSAPPKPPPIGEVIFKAFGELVDRITSITEQFGGVRKMLESKLWKDSDTGAFCVLVVEIEVTFAQWKKEVESYAKDHKTEL